MLVPLGFQAGQGGDDAGQVIWCGGHDELSEAYPGLPQAFQQPPGTCIDLVVEVGDDGTLDRLDLEAPDLVATLRQVGLEADADAVAALLGRPVDDGVTVLVGALARLFAQTGTVRR